MTLEGEALPELLQFDETTSLLVAGLDVVSGGQLALLLDPFIFDVGADLVDVSVGVVLTDLADASLRAGLCCLQVRFLDLENFFLDAVWSVDVKHARERDEQKLFVVGLGSWQSNDFADSVHAAVYLAFESVLVQVIDDG